MAGSQQHFKTNSLSYNSASSQQQQANSSAASQIVLACQKLRKANYTPIDFGEEINERQHQALVFPKYYNGKLTEVIDCAENERYKAANPCTVHRV